MYEEAVQLVCSEATHLYHRLWRTSGEWSAQDATQQANHVDEEGGDNAFDDYGEHSSFPRVRHRNDRPPLRDNNNVTFQNACALRIITVATLYGTCEIRRAETIRLHDPKALISSSMRQRLLALHALQQTLDVGSNAKLFVCWISLTDAEEQFVMGQNTYIMDATTCAESGPLWEGDVHLHHTPEPMLLDREGGDATGDTGGSLAAEAPNGTMAAASSLLTETTTTRGAEGPRGRSPPNSYSGDPPNPLAQTAGGSVELRSVSGSSQGERRAGALARYRSRQRTNEVEAAARRTSTASALLVVGDAGEEDAPVIRGPRATASSLQSVEAYTTSLTSSVPQRQPPSLHHHDGPLDVQAVALSTSRATSLVLTNMEHISGQVEHMQTLCDILDVERQEKTTLEATIVKLSESVVALEKRLEELESAAARRNVVKASIGCQYEVPGRGAYGIRVAQCQTETVVFADEVENTMLRVAAERHVRGGGGTQQPLPHNTSNNNHTRRSEVPYTHPPPQQSETTHGSHRATNRSPTYNSGSGSGPQSPLARSIPRAVAVGRSVRYHPQHNNHQPTQHHHHHSSHHQYVNEGDEQQRYTSYQPQQNYFAQPSTAAVAVEGIAWPQQDILTPYRAINHKTFTPAASPIPSTPHGTDHVMPSSVANEWLHHGPPPNHHRTPPPTQPQQQPGATISAWVNEVTAHLPEAATDHAAKSLPRDNPSSHVVVTGHSSPRGSTTQFWDPAASFTDPPNGLSTYAEPYNNGGSNGRQHRAIVDAPLGVELMSNMRDRVTSAIIDGSLSSSLNKGSPRGGLRDVPSSSMFRRRGSTPA